MGANSFVLPFLLFNCIIVLGATTNNGKYNVLLVVIDDLRASVLNSYGGKARTPNIDLLANNGGLLFERAYAQVKRCGSNWPLNLLN